MAEDEPPRKEERAPRVLRAGKCSAEARHISSATGLGIVEIENLLRAGRTKEELLVLAERRRKR